MTVWCCTLLLHNEVSIPPVNLWSLSIVPVWKDGRWLSTHPARWRRRAGWRWRPLCWAPPQTGRRGLGRHAPFQRHHGHTRIPTASACWCCLAPARRRPRSRWVTGRTLGWPYCSHDVWPRCWRCCLQAQRDVLSVIIFSGPPLPALSHSSFVSSGRILRPLSFLIGFSPTDYPLGHHSASINATFEISDLKHTSASLQNQRDFYWLSMLNTPGICALL